LGHIPLPFPFLFPPRAEDDFNELDFLAALTFFLKHDGFFPPFFFPPFPSGHIHMVIQPVNYFFSHPA